MTTTLDPGTPSPVTGIRAPGSDLGAGHTLTPNGHVDPRPRFFFDWSGHPARGIVVVDAFINGGNPPTSMDDPALLQVQIYPDFYAWFEALTEPSVLVGESTFESFEPENRKKVLELAEALGHQFLCTPNRQTKRHRQALGFEEKETDALDAFVIRDIATRTHTHLKVPSATPTTEAVERRKAANKALMIWRNTGVKEEKAIEWMANLPSLQDQPEVRRIALGEAGSGTKRDPLPRKYSHVLVAAVGVAALATGNRYDFERLAGLYHHGYPSQVRSDIFNWRWRYLRPEGQGKFAGQITLSEFRREIRWLRNQLLTSGTSDPDAGSGTSDPEARS